MSLVRAGSWRLSPATFFDVDEPPVEPPADCQHRLLWRLARALWEARRPDSTGFCVVAGCRHDNQLDPCPAAELAVDGMRTARGQPAVASPQWITLTRERIAPGEIDPVDARAEVLWHHHHQPQGGQ
jgi:hypothetical protein